MVPAPLFDKIELNSSMTVINGQIRDHESIFRQAPSPDVDAAWDYVAAEGFELIGISEEDVIKSGKDPKKCVQVPKNWNEEHIDGPQYIAQIDVFHQIHCLDMIRREAFADFYYKGSTRDEPRTSHLTHCIHIILQNLMCSADVGIITHNWIHNDLYAEEPKTRPFEDFNINKKCRNFDTLLKWTELRAIKNAHMKYSHFRWEPGMQIVPGDGYGPENISNS
ncbi:hypothetical protein V496_03472 [Pseudogymnoascus sp. VKM F-4515 (FW-2607)]|nr:hypothetical protein V496_03472 [Pseudogymnoascus sp. VKM F-4515 (FW-2607)]KFY76420.1 hypothetical protein V498_09589 [Pseudogymnoascus sp. VKM F-4517 (FW-2822)]